MALNTFKCDRLMPLHFKGLISARCQLDDVSVCCEVNVGLVQERE